MPMLHVLFGTIAAMGPTTLQCMPGVDGRMYTVTHYKFKTLNQPTFFVLSTQQGVDRQNLEIHPHISILM